MFKRVARDRRDISLTTKMKLLMFSLKNLIYLPILLPFLANQEKMFIQFTNQIMLKVQFSNLRFDFLVLDILKARIKGLSPKLTNKGCGEIGQSRRNQAASLIKTVRIVILVEVFDLNFIIQFKFLRKMTSQGIEEAKTNGRWTKQEHQKFMLGLQLYGKDWRKIQAFIGTRNGAQIRSHAQKFFIKAKKQLDNTEINDHWEQTKESPLENISLPVQQSFECQTRAEYSYYLNKIVQRDAFKETFDFWATLVDHKSLRSFEVDVNQKTKSSFVSLGLYFEELEGQKKARFL